eukprot:gnl/TRDRNA2_/TRDRNA2_178539_c0_seq1.p2 gnl/TRDRNA2_/TRDRNA2_178539_c0~~gnl/TRDRNA2_/TRDRNA2_178539_c0_seq1.p2  ORF type:complete len:267 (-),score=53.77 gnl/TRDRNA2_/TRDRNA2_178539_c0_seq1:166-966(-)
MSGALRFMMSKPTPSQVYSRLAGTVAAALCISALLMCVSSPSGTETRHLVHRDPAPQEMPAVPHKSIVRREPKPVARVAAAQAPHKSIVRREPWPTTPRVAPAPSEAETVPAVAPEPLITSSNTARTHKKLVREEPVPPAAAATPTTPRKKLVREEPVPPVVPAEAHVPLMRREPKVVHQKAAPHSLVRREAKLAPEAATGLSSLDRHTIIMLLVAVSALVGLAKQAHSAFVTLMRSPALESVLKDGKGVKWAGLAGITASEKSTQ